MVRTKYWRGRKIYYSDKYPEVYWPQHPISRSAGIVRIHRVVAYEITGGYLTAADHVHHKDENPLNWSPENLEITTNREHIRKHRLEKFNSEKVFLYCSFCGTSIEAYTGNSSFWGNKSHYCSRKCVNRGRERTNWPPDDELKVLVWSKPATLIAKQLGVSDNAIRKRCKTRSIPWPPPYFWSGKRVQP